MSSTGIINGNYDDLEADNIDVNDSLYIQKINIIELINDISENNIDLSENLNIKINDTSGNLNIKINDISGNLNDLSNTVTDLSENVATIKNDNTLQDIKLYGQGLQISANTDAITAASGLLTTNIAVTGANTVLIDGVIMSLGIPATALTPGTGIYGAIDSKTSRSLFGSGNVAILGNGAGEYINLVYNNSHFEDILGLNNRVFNLTEPYKSLPTNLNNLSDIVNTKQNIITCISPLIKDVSNNVTIDLSAYALKNALNASNVTAGTLSIARGGTGKTTLSANQLLIGNAATSILQSANLTWDNTTNTLSATNFVGSGAGISALNASNVTAGTLSIARGGIGVATLTANQLLIGNAATSILQSANLTWNNTTNTLSATNFVGSGAGISALNASNVTAGTLSIARGGTGVATLTANQLLIGNAATSILQSANLTWNNTSNTLSATNFISSGNVGIGTTITTHTLTVNGAINSTSFFQNGSQINFSSYATTSNLTNNYYDKIAIDNSLNTINNTLNTKQNNLTFTSPLLKDASNNITIDLSAYPLKSNVDTSLNNLQNTKQNNLTFTSPLLKDASNNITIDLSAYPLKTNVDTSLNNLQNTKQNILTFTSPLSKDASNNITINLSDYAIGNIKGTKATLNEGYSDTSGDNLICYHNNAGTYFTDNGFDSYFNFSSATITNTGLKIVPFITNYNRMFKNGVNNAIKIASSGYANSNVNSSTYILLDSGSNPTPSTNVGTIKFNIATNTEGALDRFVINPTTSIFYNNVGIGRTPNYTLDVSGNINSNMLFENNTSLVSKYATIENLNLKQSIITCVSPLLKDASNNITIDLSAYAFKNALNASNVTAGTLPVSFGGTGSTSLSTGQILIGSGTNPLLQTANLTWDNTNNVFGTTNINVTGKITTNLLDVSGNINIQNSSSPNNTTILINSETNSYNSKLILGSGYIGSNPVNSFTDISTCQIITKRNNLYIDAAVGKTININSEANGNINSFGGWSHNGNIATNDISVNTIYVNNDIVTSKIYASNGTSKSLIKFQTKLGANGLYYYNIDLSKYYKTGQTINGNEYKVFNLTSWAEDAFSIINKCTVYISSQSPGYKYIMFNDNWGAYLSNGNQSGWQADRSTGFMTFVTATQKNIITILENLL